MTDAAGGAVTVRPAARRDLDDLVKLEQSFPGDRLSRSGLARLLTRDSAEVWVAELGGQVVGDAIVLYRRGHDSARLYSLVVEPESRGRGVAKQLLTAAEEGAREHGAIIMRLEVREENSTAIALYEQAGYSIRDRSEEYYEDDAAALKMYKRLVSGKATVRGVPYRQQALGFTSGPASLMMAMRFHDYPVPLDDWLELTLWRESTTTFEQGGAGGVTAQGLAVAALRRGFQASVIVDAASSPHDGLTGDARKAAAIADASFDRELRSLGGKVDVRPFSHQDLVEALERGSLPVMLLTATDGGVADPRWVVVTGYDQERLYLHDPNPTAGSDRADSVHLPIPRDEFDARVRSAAPHYRSVVLLDRWGSVNRRQPSS